VAGKLRLIVILSAGGVKVPIISLAFIANNTEKIVKSDERYRKGLV